MTEPATLPVSRPAAPAPARPHASRWTRSLDGLLVGTVVAFAFLSGSFIARNTDLWLHLAAGRLIASGEFSFGVDPFAQSTVGRYWANHAWLFDLGLFHLYRSLGGAGLVLVKAGLVAGMAGVMFAIARGRAPTWLITGSLLLALLAMAPRLLLQPTIASYLLLAVCLYCLERGGCVLVAVPVLIALWVNLDSWFLLGPLLVVLVWLGRRLDPARESLPSWPRWLMPASFLACLISPHHVFAMTLPAEISPTVWASGIATDPRFAGYFASPWHAGPLGSSGGYNLAVWAFFILLGLGLLSFLLNPSGARSWRGLAWLLFALLAAWQSRLIPFFAVVAGPITALNLGEVIPRESFIRPARALVLVAAAALLGLGWMGWTVGFRNRERAPAWGIHSDPTLECAANGIARWRQDNRVSAETTVFTTHPDLGHYLAWFAPSERSTIDSRFTLFADYFAEYSDLTRALGLLPEFDSPAVAVGELLQRRKIRALSLYDPDPRRMTSALRTILKDDPPLWIIARIDGGTALIVPHVNLPLERAFDAERLALGTPGEGFLPAGNGPDRLVEPAPFRVLKRSSGRLGSAEADSATVYLRLFEDRFARGTEQAVPIMLGRRAGEKIWASRSPARSPALPLLAIRAARRGAEIDSTDPTAWLMLGRAYALLGEQTWEREAGDPLTLLGQLRHVQSITALVQAAILNPDSLLTRQTLARAYDGQQVLDLAQRHALEALRIVRRSGPAPGEPRESFDERAARLAELAERIEGMVLDAENRYLVKTAGLAGEPLARARIARDLGLTQKAIDVLIGSHPDLYGGEGIGLLIELLLQTGQAPEARALLEREEIQRNPGSLGMAQILGKPHPDGHRWAYRFPSYTWLALCLAVGSGQYDHARTLLDDLCEDYDRQEQVLRPGMTIELVKATAGEIGLAAPGNAVFNRFWATHAKETQSELWRHSHLLSVHRADLQTIAGVLELERGNPPAARNRFAAAMALYETNRPSAPALPGLALASRYLEALRSQP